jgi:hypothetical protein
MGQKRRNKEAERETQIAMLTSLSQMDEEYIGRV